MELVKPVEPVLWASIVELVIGGTGYGTVEALVSTPTGMNVTYEWSLIRLKMSC